MICKQCGAEIDPSAQVCPKCGESVPAAAATAEPKAQPRAAGKKRVAVRLAVLPVLLGLALCALGIWAAVASRVTAGEQIKAMDDEYESRMEAQAQHYEARIEELEEQLRTMQEQGVSVTGGKKQAAVTHYPTNEVQSVGASERVLFVFQLDGPADRFTWEKRNSDGSWSPLVFDAAGYDAQHGLYREEDLAQGLSRLLAAGLTMAANGAYRCTAESGDAEAQVEVTLSVLQQVTPGATGTAGTADSETTAEPENTPDPEATPAAEPAPEGESTPTREPAPATDPDPDMIIIISS